MLRDIVRQNGIARVEELCKRLKVSPATIRRDLEQLEESGRIRRVHGGAVSLESRLEEPLFDDKTSIAAREKRRIAAAAAKYVHSGDVIYLDGGSTVLELARLLADRTDITVVTNSLRAAVELSGRGPRLILAGGELRRLSQTTVGPLTTPLLQQVQVNTAFMGTMGLTVSDGLTTTDPAEAFTKEFVLSRADRTVLLADRTKLGKVAFVNAGAVKHVDVLITDKAADKKTIAAIKKSGVKVVGV
jgi:DeoR/GlpR family transcriptional regulator of sugar metabolism